MSKGISIHIGLNYINPAHYGYNGKLPYCENDAIEMRKLAIKEGYHVQDFLINENATATNVTTSLSKAAEILEPGDKLFLTYSGHGSYFPDMNKDEDKGDKYDETWVLYDRMFIDDELYFAWSKFRKGVRIVLISDSCHSGTVAKPLLMSNLEKESAENQLTDVPDNNALMEILKSEAQRLYKKHKAQYDPHLKFVPNPNEITIQASVILLAASKDNQVSMGVSRSGNKLSLFTDELLTVYLQKNTKLNYCSFLEEIKKRIPKNYAQTPNYFKTGVLNKKFLKQRPFVI